MTSYMGNSASVEQTEIERKMKCAVRVESRFVEHMLQSKVTRFVKANGRMPVITMKVYDGSCQSSNELICAMQLD